MSAYPQRHPVHTAGRYTVHRGKLDRDDARAAWGEGPAPSGVLRPIASFWFVEDGIAWANKCHAEDMARDGAKHTPGPWEADSDGHIYHAPTDEDADPHVARANRARPEHAANAARIVACVNACEGIDDPAVGLAKVRAALLAARGWLRHGADGGGRAGDVEDAMTAALALLGGE